MSAIGWAGVYIGLLLGLAAVADQDRRIAKLERRLAVAEAAATAQQARVGIYAGLVNGMIADRADLACLPLDTN